LSCNIEIVLVKYKYIYEKIKKPMGTVELIAEKKLIQIHSWIITYGNGATESLTAYIRDEIETMWNEPKANIRLNNDFWKLQFVINAYMRKNLTAADVEQNVNPKNNYIRIEEFAHGNISYVDGLGSNTGYWKLENLYQGSTTAAHEYGHTLGLPHPADLDYRGKAAPGIMYPRGTLVDAAFQYNPNALAGEPGGTMHPMHRKVRQEDIEMLGLQNLRFQNNAAIIGNFTSVWHNEEKA
jgi:hypothetical protein